jgi:hypothetical protein
MAALGSGVAAATTARSGRVELESKDGRIDVRVAGKPFFTYHEKPVEAVGRDPLFTRGAYIHPVHAPNGAVVTDDFADDHPHQRGVFFAWTKTEVGSLHPDFWNLGSGLGRVRCERTSVFGDKESRLGFRAWHLWEMKDEDAWKPAIDETWEVTVPAQQEENAFRFDLVSRQKPRVNIHLPEHRYGGMAVRGARQWLTEKGVWKVLTSEGKDSKTADATRGRWVDQSGPIGPQTAGITQLEHPANPGAPTMLRVPPDHPYAVFSLPKGGPYTLEAGKEYVFRFGFVTHNGIGEAASCNRWWDSFRA